MPKYLVEGAYSDDNDGAPVTADYVVAENEEAAVKMVADIRDQIDEWNVDRAISFEDYVIEMRDLIRKLEAMTEDEVTGSWLDTRKNLGFADERPSEDPV